MTAIQVGDIVTANSTLDPGSVGYPFLIRLRDQESRLIGSAPVLNNRADFPSGRNGAYTGSTFWGFLPTNDSYQLHRDNAIYRSAQSRPSYLPYPPTDGIAIPSSAVPVNQIPHIREWRDRLAVFAHHLDLAHGSYTVDVELGEADRAALFLYGQILIGNALNELDEWEVIDPQHRFIRNGEEILSWKDGQPRVENAVMATGEDHWWGRLMAEHANLPLFAVAMGHGRLQVVNRSAATWVPGAVIGQALIPPPVPPVLPSPEESAIAIAAWLTETAARWRESRNHYDTVIGPRETAFEARLREDYPLP